MTHNLDLITKKLLQLQSRRPFPSALQQNLNEWFRVELTYSSNAIEGNTLSRIETAEILERGLAAVVSNKPLRDQIEAINHAKALDFIEHLNRQYLNAQQNHQFITENDIKAIHTRILSGIQDEYAGKYRETEIFIKGSSYQFPLPQEVPVLMREFVQWLELQQEDHPVRIAANAHYRFVTIHPFLDGNGRTGRLLMNLILHLNGYPMTIIRNEDRTEYLESLRTAQQEHNFLPFYNVIEQAVLRSVEMLLDAGENKKSSLKSTSLSVAQQKSTPSTKLLKASELARLTHEAPHTIRFWTREGLIPVTSRTPGGYQLFNLVMVERVKEIRKLQEVERRTLKEIKDMFVVSREKS